jgi:hypothetical protein
LGGANYSNIYYEYNREILNFIARNRKIIEKIPSNLSLLTLTGI